MASNDEKSIRGELLAAISNLVVRTYADHLGRGPTKARTYINENVVVCLLEDTLTKAEKSLLAAGREATVLDMRYTMQDTMRNTLVANVEQLTGRTVVAFISGNNADPDFASELFVLDQPLQATNDATA